jgi:predicted MFS family arabinose efflux permease
MANAGGRLAGTILSGLVYQTQGLTGCLWWSAAFVLAAAVLSFKLPELESSSESGKQAARV